MNDNHKSLKVFKIRDECLFGIKWELHVNGSFYTSNISKKLKNKYVNKFKQLGYIITNGCSDQLNKIQ